MTKKTKKFLYSMLSVVVGGAISALSTLYVYNDSIEVSSRIEMTRLVRDLNNQFSYGENNRFAEIRMAIDNCQPLYDGWANKYHRGKFSSDDINLYLNFFDDLGFYEKQGVLTVDIIDNFFGAVVVEAYEYKELKRYVKELREGHKQPQAFDRFYDLAELLEKRHDRKELVNMLRGDPCETGVPHPSFIKESRIYFDARIRLDLLLKVTNTHQ